MGSCASRPGSRGTPVGLGLLGHAVASRLAAAGHAAVGYDVAPDRPAALTALVGKAAGSAADVVAGAEAVVTVLPSLETVERAILGPDGVLAGAPPGQAVIQMSTISPELTERLAAEVERRGRMFRDCPVSGTSGQVARGEGLIMVGGERVLFARGPGAAHGPGRVFGPDEARAVHEGFAPDRGRGGGGRCRGAADRRRRAPLRRGPGEDGRQGDSAWGL